MSKKPDNVCSFLNKLKPSKAKQAAVQQGFIVYYVEHLSERQVKILSRIELLHVRLFKGLFSREIFEKLHSSN